MPRGQLNQAGLCCRPLITKSFVVSCPLAVIASAFYPVLVHQPAASLHASSPRSVTVMQSHYASLRLLWINLLWNFHPQECAYAGRT